MVLWRLGGWVSGCDGLLRWFAIECFHVQRHIDRRAKCLYGVLLL